jgi:hypothetical protein
LIKDGEAFGIIGQRPAGDFIDRAPAALAPAAAAIDATDVDAGGWDGVGDGHGRNMALLAGFVIAALP